MGVLCEVPLMIPHLPEGWSITILISTAVQVPFIASIIILVIYSLCPSYMKENLAIYSILGLGVISMLLLSAFWKSSVIIYGKSHSVALLILITILGIVDNSSSVIFFPYVKKFPLVYLRALFVGEGLTGMIPAILKIIQGGAIPYCRNVSTVRGIDNTTIWTLNEEYTNPHFSVSTYFIVLAIILLTSFVSFILIENCPAFTQIAKMHTRNRVSVDQTFDVIDGQLFLLKDEMKKYTETGLDNKQLSKCEYWYLQGQTCFSSFLLWGVVYSLYTYSLLPYGFKITNIALILMNILRIGAYALASLIPLRTISKINIINLFFVIPSLYLIFCAAMSPCPPFVDTKYGGLIVIVCFILCDFIMTWIRTCVGDLMMVNGGNSLMVFGMLTNVGISVGAISCVIIDLKYHLLQSRNICKSLSSQCTGYRSRFL
ncbi:hypothetical protein GJ496_003503 [Pomphorhynchus laevis]|nr:hypothetical protein GJ496_003503 [Pomphorhynchus laevis]